MRNEVDGIGLDSPDRFADFMTRVLYCMNKVTTEHRAPLVRLVVFAVGHVGLELVVDATRLHTIQYNTIHMTSRHKHFEETLALRSGNVINAILASERSISHVGLQLQVKVSSSRRAHTHDLDSTSARGEHHKYSTVHYLSLLATVKYCTVLTLVRSQCPIVRRGSINRTEPQRNATEPPLRDDCACGLAQRRAVISGV